ncbi:hypothetical protein GWI33_000038 [Rhynchophorus ferrugineus]|uniref:Uncharacterized protein n=1 Tax=Rhynchophorus ferrugineus TaxID=354439 RepID=A0A834J0K6_RHYFE|nr:hypothetical protein GWI33_000038 [Rhynchophorus ferrugineus]
MFLREKRRSFKTRRYVREGQGSGGGRWVVDAAAPRLFSQTVRPPPSLHLACPFPLTRYPCHQRWLCLRRRVTWCIIRLPAPGSVIEHPHNAAKIHFLLATVAAAKAFGHPAPPPSRYRARSFIIRRDPRTSQPCLSILWGVGGRWNAQIR